MPNNGRIAIIDLGGQYCHLIARRLRDLAVNAEIFASATGAEALSAHAGIILSGGPQSVYDPDAVTIDERILQLGVPVLGICYGHQLMAKLLGGEVAGHDGEYGFTQLRTHLPSSAGRMDDGLFAGTPPIQQVWMSHADAVRTLPPALVPLAATDRCMYAAFADLSRQLFGVQFHPEVVHTEHGSRLLENFVRNVCHIGESITFQSRISGLCERIHKTVADRSVFFLVSGGVDSTVAFVLCGMTLPKARVLGLYIDTGLMRLGETDELRANLASVGLADRIKIWDASEQFLSALEGKTDPEEKRQIIGRLFIEIQAQAMYQLGIDPAHWLLGQGTIYPDTIESGGDTGRAAVIKTHHNRCDEVRELLRQGKVIEPLAEFYKDEVRVLGRELGLSARITDRWPFPGPGLAIRCLCTNTSRAAESLPPECTARLRPDDLQGILLPLRTVGVQGDARTYRMVVALEQTDDEMNYDTIRRLSSTLCNQSGVANRVVLLLRGIRPLPEARVELAGLTRRRLDLLRQADSIARLEIERANLAHTVWQFPVVLAPIAFGNGESVILRPVNSTDGMTANFATLPAKLLHSISQKILSLPEIDAVFLDVTNKPPATIEWE
jgi:GMP synthase (glutamine-hydrolysing)